MEKIILGIIYIYMASVGVFAIYYNYLYANEHGFISWLFFGEIIASLQAFIWPLFEFGLI